MYKENVCLLVLLDLFACAVMINVISVQWDM